MSDILKSFGQLLDEYLGEYPNYETIVFSHDKDANPILFVTQAETSYDYTDVFTEVIDLRAEVTVKRKEVEKLQAKLRSLERDKKSIESAIKKLVKFSKPSGAPR